VSARSRTINTSFVERQHATDRGQNARKSRRTCGHGERRGLRACERRLFRF
jgi:hypothetical protein